MLVRSQRKQMRPQRRLARKIKAARRRRRKRLRQLRLAHPNNRKPKARLPRLQHLLARNPQRLREDRAQALVPRNNITERRLQRRNVERTTQPHRQRDRVGRAGALQPIQEPQPTLRKRQRDLGRPLTRTQRRARLLPHRQPPRQRRHARRLEQHPDRKLDIKARTNAADQPRRQQRMTPKLEEVVVDADARETPRTSANSAHSTSSCGVRGPRNAARRHRLRRRQRTPVELAVGRQRQPLQHHQRSRHHVVRKPLGQAPPATKPHRPHNPPPPPHSPPAAAARPHPRARSPPPAKPPHSPPAQPRSRQARCGTRAASPAHPHAPGTPAPRPHASAPNPRSGTSARRRAHAGRQQTAPPSAPLAPDNPAQAPHPKCKAPPQPQQAQAPAHRPKHKPACSRSAGRWGHWMATPTRRGENRKMKQRESQSGRSDCGAVHTLHDRRRLEGFRSVREPLRLARHASRIVGLCPFSRMTSHRASMTRLGANSSFIL